MTETSDIRKIGILTGGGDVPGLNGVIKGVTYRAHELDFEVLNVCDPRGRPLAGSHGIAG